MRSIRRGSCDAPSKCGLLSSSLNSILHLCINFILLAPCRLINHVMKQGSGTANTLGTLAVLYSACGVLLQYIRDQDDNVNTIIAGSATGLLYKSTGESVPPLTGKTLHTQTLLFPWLLQLAFENVPWVVLLVWASRRSIAYTCWHKKAPTQTQVQNSCRWRNHWTIEPLVVAINPV